MGSRRTGRFRLQEPHARPMEANKWKGASPPREVARRRPQTGRETNPRSPSRDPASAKGLAVGRKRLRCCAQHALVSSDELPPQFWAESRLFRSLVQWILQPQVCVIHGRQGMVRMYSTLTKAPKHAVVVISELLAAHGQSVHERGDSLVFNIGEGPNLSGFALDSSGAARSN